MRNAGETRCIALFKLNFDTLHFLFNAYPIKIVFHVVSPSYCLPATTMTTMTHRGGMESALNIERIRGKSKTIEEGNFLIKDTTHTHPEGRDEH